MKLNFLALTAFFLLTSTYSQHLINGTITDASNGNPLEQVSVYFPQLERGTVTDANGQFKITDLPDGTYKFIASLIGFKTFSSTITLQNQKEALQIELQPSAIEIEEVIVSTPFHKLQRENVMKVEQAQTKELKKTGAITLAEGLTQINGVETVSTGMGIGKPVIRGLSANRVLVYAQGIRLENQQFGDEHGLGINGGGIESIEVIKGPASLLYGSDALGGVIYLNPERFIAAGEQGGDVNYTYNSNTSGSQTSAGVQISGERLKFLGRFGYQNHADYKGGDGTRITNSRFLEKDLKTGLAYQFSRFKSELRYNYNTSDLGIPEELGIQNKDRTPLLPYQNLSNHILSSTSEWFFENSSLKAVFGFISNDRKEFEEHHHEEEHAEEDEHEGQEEHEEETDEAALDMRLNTLSYNLQYQFNPSANWVTVLGVQGMRQTNTNSGEELLIPDAVTQDLGILATSHIHLGTNDIQLGLRYDHRNIDSEAFGDIGSEEFIDPLKRDFNSFNAAAGIRSDIGKNLIGRLNLASGFRAPNLAELTSKGSHGGTNRYELGNSNLKNEKNIQLDLALEYENEHFEWFINGFHNRINDYIYLQPTGSLIEGDPVYEYVQQNAILQGGELGFHLHPHPLDWVHLESNFSYVYAKQENDTPLPLIPAAKWVNSLRFEWKSGTSTQTNNYGFITLESIFDQNRVSAFETPTAGYNLVHLGIGSDMAIGTQTIELSLSVNNLLNQDYVSHLSRLKPDGLLNMGRNLSLGATLYL